jgi:hypothetical protein
MIERAILHSDVGTYLRGIMISPAFFEDAMNWEGYAIYEAPVFLKKEMISWSSDQLAKRFQAEFSKYGLGLILNVEVRSKGSLAHELEGAEVTVFLAGLQAEFAKLMAEPHWVVKRAEGFSDSKHWWENDHDQEPEERTNLVDIRNLILNPTQYYASDKLAMTVRKGGSVAEFVSLLTGSSVKDAMRFKPICTRLGLAPLTLS